MKPSCRCSSTTTSAKSKQLPSLLSFCSCWFLLHYVSMIKCIYICVLFRKLFPSWVMTIMMYDVWCMMLIYERVYGLDKMGLAVLFHFSLISFCIYIYIYIIVYGYWLYSIFIFIFILISLIKRYFKKLVHLDQTRPRPDWTANGPIFHLDHHQFLVFGPVWSYSGQMTTAIGQRWWYRQIVLEAI